MHRAVHAVVIGANLGGLGAVRSLARGGVATAIVGSTWHHPGMRSRLCRKFVFDQLHGRSLVDGLLTIKKRLSRRPALIVTDPLAAETVSEHREELLQAYGFHLPPRDVVAMLQSEARFHAFAAEHELPIPGTIIMDAGTPFDALASLTYPAVVKASGRRPNHAGAAPRVHFAETMREAETICRTLLESASELVVQEWVDGPESNVCFAMFYLGHRPENFKLFVGRKLASRPAKIGNAALCLAAPELTDALEPAIAKYLDLTDFQGLGSLEFKWDLQQRRYVIVGLAVGRMDWHAEIATLGGVNLPLAAYRDEAGLPPLPATPIDRKVAWRESALMADELPVLSQDTRIHDGYWRFSDPMPALTHYSRALGMKLRRHLARALVNGGSITRRTVALETKLRKPRKPVLNRNSPGTP